MIGRLRGVIVGRGEDWVIIEAAGVGYEVHCTSRLLAALAAHQGEAILAIETHVREDQIRLYGFQSEAERQWFRLLQSVQGVGARVALSILGTLSLPDLANAIALQDKAMVSRAPHVGAKLAQRVVAELKDKVPVLGLPQMAPLRTGKPAAAETTANADAISALVNLGYQNTQASLAVAAAFRELGASAGTAELIRRGLKELAR